MSDNHPDSLYQRIRDILNVAQIGVSRTVNTAHVVSYWLIGREIVEQEQKGQQRAEYGESLLKDLSRRLTKDVGKGFSLSNLKYIRQFYLGFPDLLTATSISHAVRDQSLSSDQFTTLSQSQPNWQPGQLHPNLSWTHYRTLLRVENLNARAFYEIEVLKNTGPPANSNAKLAASYLSVLPKAPTKPD